MRSVLGHLNIFLIFTITYEDLLISLGIQRDVIISNNECDLLFAVTFQASRIRQATSTFDDEVPTGSEALADNGAVDPVPVS